MLHHRRQYQKPANWSPNIDELVTEVTYIFGQVQASEILIRNVNKNIVFISDSFSDWQT